MIWVRKGLVHFFSLLLLVSLVGGAVAFSTNTAVSKPDKIKTWLEQSKLYDGFTTYATEQGQKSAGSQSRSGSVVLSNPEVKQAAEAAFPTSLLKQSVGSFLDSNYAWLKGNTSTPNFTIDLGNAKQSFAERVGQYVQTRLTELPVCSKAQLAKIGSAANIDPLTTDCRPSKLNPKAAGAETTRRIATSGSFLDNPVITAQTINPESNGQGREPYYAKLSEAPKAYRLAQRLPLILGVLALLSILAIVLIAPLRRRGVRRTGLVILLAAVILLLAKFAADFGFRKAEQRVFNDAGVGPLQKSLVDFVHRLENQINTVNVYFALGFLALAIIILVYLRKTRQPAGPKTPEDRVKPAEPGSKVTPDDIRLAPRRQQSPKPPRLVQ